MCLQRFHCRTEVYLDEFRLRHSSTAHHKPTDVGIGLRSGMVESKETQMKISAVQMIQQSVLYSLGCDNIQWAEDGSIWVTLPCGLSWNGDVCELICRLTDFSLTGFLLSQIAKKSDEVTKPEFKCDVCERSFRGETIASTLLPLSVFCGEFCRDEAEESAIDALSTVVRAYA